MSWLVAGLGNPGKKYARNRHNVGFMVLDLLAGRHSMPDWREKFGGEVTSGRLGSDKALLLKPMEYMNHSGFAVTRAARFHQIDPERIVVVHDEIDLPFGRIRVKAGGGHGGHNGLRDIIRHCGANFMRLRIGVGHPGEKDKVTGYVLKAGSSDVEAAVVEAIDTALEVIPLLAEKGVEAAMNRLHTVLKRSG